MEDFEPVFFGNVGPLSDGYDVEVEETGEPVCHEDELDEAEEVVKRMAADGVKGKIIPR